MTDRPLTFDRLPSLVGHDLGVSSWLTVDQAMIDGFAETTGDRQWIHVDVDRARRESPYGAPIAHGYLTLALVPRLSEEIGAVPEGTALSINYGLDRLRFLSPVRAGARVRLRSRLAGVEEKGPGQVLLRIENTVEIEGEEKPALAATALVLHVRAPQPE